MAWWKKSSALKREKVMLKIIKCEKHDSCAVYRKDAFIELLDASAEESVFYDVDTMSTITGCGIKHCKRVWAICIEEGVLRPTANGEGYNALEWMVERGYFGDGRSPEQRGARGGGPPPYPPKGGGGGEVQNRNSFININREVT